MIKEEIFDRFGPLIMFSMQVPDRETFLIVCMDVFDRPIAVS